MLLTNSELQNKLNTVGTKNDWSQMIKTELGATRRLRIWRDNDAQSTNPVASGTEVLNVGMTGEIVIVGAEIRAVGETAGTTVRLAADLLSGKSMLRIEGNNNWIGGTCGLTPAAQIAAGVASGDVKRYDFELVANLTTTSGIAFSSDFVIKPPRLLPSGTGPVAGTITANTPTIVELVDWTNPAAPTVVGIATFTNRLDNWVYEDPKMAAETGDIALYTLNDSIKWTSPAPNERFELGGTLAIANKVNTETGVNNLEQILLSFKPYQRWPNYPFMDGQVKWTYDANGVVTNPTLGDYTYPPPFKINLYTEAGYKNGAADRTPLYTHEIKAFNDKPSGPINGPEWLQAPTDDEPCIPHFNCAQALPWQNTRSKRSSQTARYVPGFTAFSLGGTANDTASCNPTVPLIYNGGQQNSTNHFYAMPKYPMKNAKAGKYSGWDEAYMNAYWPALPADPKLFSAKQTAWWTWMSTGYAWQPGSISGHDWLTGPGGMRFDRYVLPAVLAHWTTDPNWYRPQGNVPIRDMVDGWGFSYFNHSNHWMPNVKDYTYLPKQLATEGSATFANAYYGGGPYGALGQPRGPDKTVDLFPLYNNYRDPKGRFPYGFWKRDGLHAYANAGFYAMLLNSPIHAIAQMHDYHAQWMSQLGGSTPQADPAPNANLDEHLYQYRTQAWRWLSYTMTWICATSHPWGFSQREIEDRFAIELELLYDKIYKPAFVDNNPSAYFTAIRNLGVAIKKTSTNDHTSNGGSLGLYMVHTLVLMRQTGLWAKMRARSTKCREALDMVIRNYDKSVVDYCHDTKMRGAYYPVISYGKGTSITGADIPADWVAYDTWLETNYPPLPANTPEVESDDPTRWIDFVTRYTGRKQEVTGHPYLWYQYMCARRDYFPENPPAKLAAAITKMEAWFASYDEGVVANNGYPRKMLHPQSGALLPPSVVGPN